MNSRNQDPYVDSLLRQAMQSYAHARPPASVWRRLRRRVQGAAPRRWPGLFSWLWRPFTSYSHLPYQPYAADVSGRSPSSPFMGMMVKQMLDLRLAS